MQKSIGFQRRHPSLTPEQFGRRWLIGHKPLANRAHGFQRYVCTLIEDRLGDTEDYDGIGEMWFESREAARDRLYLHPDSARLTGHDARHFLGEGRNFAVLPAVLKGPPELERGPSPGVAADGFTIPTAERKVFATITRPAGENAEAFAARARTAAAALAAQFPGLTALTWNAVPPSRRDVLGFDAVLEAFFSEAAPADLLPALRDVFVELLGGRLGRSGLYRVVERVQWGEGDPRPVRDETTRYKLFSQNKRRDRQAHEEYVQKWVVDHKPLAIQHHGFRRYVCNIIEGRAGRAGDWDGMMEMWFDSEEAIAGRHYFYGEESRRAAALDSRGFLSRSARTALIPFDVKGTPELERAEGATDEQGRTQPTPYRKVVGTITRPRDENREAFSRRGLAGSRALAGIFPGLVALTWNRVPDEALPDWSSPPDLSAPRVTYDAVIEGWFDDAAPVDLLQVFASAVADHVGGGLGETAWYLVREYVQFSLGAEGAGTV
jgi:hypothetical protein